MKPQTYRTVRHSLWCDFMRKHHIPTKPVGVWRVLLEVVGGMLVIAAIVNYIVEAFNAV